MKALIQFFLTHLEHERQLSKHSLKNYKLDLEKAAEFFINLHIQDWVEVNDETIRALIVFNRKQKRMPRTINRQLSVLRTFYEYLIRENKASQNPAANITSLKTARQLPKPLDVDEMTQLLTFETNSNESIRDAAILELLYSSGVRISELQGLNLSDLDLEEHQAHVLGKGKKSRIVILGRMAIKALKKWLITRQTLADTIEQALFVNNKGKRLSIRSIQHRIYEIGVQQGLNTRVHPHRLRHSFASHLLESSSDLRSVQELLGHASINTTQIYTQLNFQHLATIYDLCHPRAHQKKREGGFTPDPTELE